MSSAPQPYERVTSFYSYEATYPSRPKPGADLDAEFNVVRATLNAVLSRLNEIQRDDGLLANSIVTPQSLTSETILLLGRDFVPRGSWSTATVYEPGDLVERATTNYLCIVNHLSDDFDVDLASGRWQAFGGLPTAAQVVFAPAGTVGSVSVQDAIIELDGDVQGKQAASANLSALSAVSGAADTLPYWTSGSAMGSTSLTAFARTLLDDADAAAARATLGLTIGTAAGNVVQLDGSGKLPAVDGSQLTGISTSGIVDGSITAAKLAGTLNLSGKTITLPAANTPALTKEFTSSELTIANGGGGTIAHGLGVVPKLIQVLLICKTAEQGYSIGDTVVWGTFWQSQDRGLSVGGDATNITYRYAAQATPFSYLHKSTGASDVLTNANWRVIIKAWA